MKSIPCNICGESNSIEMLQGHDYDLPDIIEEFTLVKCKSCSLVYVNPQPSPAELAKHYPADYSPYRPPAIFVYGPVLRTVQKILHAFRPLKSEPASTTSAPSPVDDSEKAVLDFGCGSGLNLLALQVQHPRWKLFGFDLATNEDIKKIGRDITIYQGDFAQIQPSLAPVSFDSIYLNNVLEHVSNPRQTLNDLRTLLKDDGEMILEVPNIDCVKFRIFGKYFSSLDLPRHLYHFSPDTLRKLCELSGLRIASLHVTGTPKSTLLSLHHFFGIQRRAFNPIAYRMVELVTRLLGERNINTDAISARITKAHEQS